MKQNSPYITCVGVRLFLVSTTSGHGVAGDWCVASSLFQLAFPIEWHFVYSTGCNNNHETAHVCIVRPTNGEGVNGCVFKEFHSDYQNKLSHLSKWARSYPEGSMFRQGILFGPRRRLDAFQSDSPHTSAKRHLQ